MTRDNQHDLDLHNRLVRELIENHPLLRDFRISELVVSEGGNKVSLVLVRKDIEGEGFLMMESETA